MYILLGIAAQRGCRIEGQDGTESMLRDGTFYQDLGPDHFSRRAKGDRTVRLVRHHILYGVIGDQGVGLVHPAFARAPEDTRVPRCHDL